MKIFYHVIDFASKVKDLACKWEISKNNRRGYENHFLEKILFEEFTFFYWIHWLKFVLNGQKRAVWFPPPISANRTLILAEIFSNWPNFTQKNNHGSWTIFDQKTRLKTVEYVQFNYDHRFWLNFDQFGFSWNSACLEKPANFGKRLA
jgi:hypothetical protein